MSDKTALIVGLTIAYLSIMSALIMLNARLKRWNSVPGNPTAPPLKDIPEVPAILRRRRASDR